MNFDDAPSVTVTTTSNYDQSATISHPADLSGTGGVTDDRPPPAQETAAVTGSIVDEVTQSLDESLGGSGASVTGDLTTGNGETITTHANLTGSMTAGSLDETQWTSTAHALAGSEAAGAALAGTDTTTSHAGDNRLADVTTTEGSQSLHAIWSANTGDYQVVTAQTGPAGQSVSAVSGGGSAVYTLTSIWSGPEGTATWIHSGADAWAYALQDGAVALVGATHSERIQIGGADVGTDGNNPLTGGVIPKQDYDPHDPPPGPPHEPADWFEALSDFGAGMGDKVSGGLTKRVRQGLGYDDVVNYGSGAYAAGEIAGTVVSTAVENLTPCRAVGLAQMALRGLHAVQGVANTIDASDAFSQGDIVGGLSSLQAARGSFGMVGTTCFVAGTPLLTPDGSQPIEQFQVGDLVLSRSEHDPNGAVRPRRVLEVFARVSPVLDLRVGGATIGTTGEHPFYAKGKGWLPAGALRPGDELLAHDGRWQTVREVADGRRVVTVYNLEVEDDHTYFVGCLELGWSVWAHNGPICVGNILKNAKAGRAREQKAFQLLKKQNPGAKVQRERYLRDAKGKRIIDTTTQEARRIDLAVIKDGRVKKLYEVTSLTAPKDSQLAKEARIRALGGVYIRDAVTKQLLKVNSVKTRVMRLK